jgi:hypothetical protein
MFKKAVQQGRSERRGEAYSFPYVESLSDARTKLGERRVLARRGWAGEKTDFFNILLMAGASIKGMPDYIKAVAEREKNIAF